MKVKYKTYFITVATIVVILYYIVIHFNFNFIRSPDKSVKLKASNLKYILQWTETKRHFRDMGKGRQVFIDSQCPHTNCFVSSNHEFFEDIKNFDVIAFHGPEIFQQTTDDFPKHRSLKQKYVLASMESASNYPVCSGKFDGFFNWTWTYKLDSEIQWGYVVVRDNIYGTKVGPKTNMNWISQNDMYPVPDILKKQLKGKSKAAAWVVSNCLPRNDRNHIAAQLQYELRFYNMTLDTYGKCGLKCPDDNCWKTVKDDYYFYLSFENSNSEDYVTEKLLNALHNNAVPIVYGGANYTRFMPHGMYLNAKELEPSKLAAKIYELIRDPIQYYEYFKWRNHYYYVSTIQTVDTNEYCRMCALLNDEREMERTTIYKNFREYWEQPGDCDWK